LVLSRERDCQWAESKIKTPKLEEEKPKERVKSMLREAEINAGIDQERAYS